MPSHAARSHQHYKATSQARERESPVEFFAAIALVAMAVDRELGLYVVAAGWAGHAVWIFFRLWYDKVVSRSFAEWCGVFDPSRCRRHPAGVLALAASVPPRDLR
jgi:hypothetical protein